MAKTNGKKLQSRSRRRKISNGITYAVLILISMGIMNQFRDEQEEDGGGVLF